MSLHQAPKALVVDDEVLVSIQIEDILRTRGYDVTVVNNRLQLQSVLDGDRFALAVASAHLANYAEMKSWKVDRIVICTGSAKSTIEDEFPEMPYVAKPFTDADFDAVLGSFQIATR